MRHKTLAILASLGASLCFSIPASAHPLSPLPTTPVVQTVEVQPPTYPQVVVKAGDTIWALSLANNVTWPNLAGYNNLNNPDLIYPGEALKIPPPTYEAPVPPPAPVSPPVPPQGASAETITSAGIWGCIAQEESGNTNANKGNGYYGYFQFLPSTFTAVTGLPGLPSSYSYGTQLAAAQKLQAEAGWGQWPLSSKACGV